MRRVSRMIELSGFVELTGAAVLYYNNINNS